MLSEPFTLTHFRKSNVFVCTGNGAESRARSNILFTVPDEGLFFYDISQNRIVSSIPFITGTQFSSPSYWNYEEEKILVVEKVSDGFICRIFSSTSNSEITSKKFHFDDFLVSASDSEIFWSSKQGDYEIVDWNLKVKIHSRVEGSQILGISFSSSCLFSLKDEMINCIPLGVNLNSTISVPFLKGDFFYDAKQSQFAIVENDSCIFFFDCGFKGKRKEIKCPFKKPKVLFLDSFILIYGNNKFLEVEIWDKKSMVKIETKLFDCAVDNIYGAEMVDKLILSFGEAIYAISIVKPKTLLSLIGKGDGNAVLLHSMEYLELAEISNVNEFQSEFDKSIRIQESKLTELIDKLSLIYDDKEFSLLFFKFIETIKKEERDFYPNELSVSFVNKILLVIIENDLIWPEDVILFLLKSKCASTWSNPKLVDKIINKNASELIYNVLLNVKDLRNEQLVSILVYLLNEYTSFDYLKLTKEQYLFENDYTWIPVISLVLNFPIGKKLNIRNLGLQDITKLFYLLLLWLQRYENDVIVNSKFNIYIPTIRKVIEWISWIISSHFATLILNPDFLPIIQEIQEKIQTEIDLCGKVEGLKQFIGYRFGTFKEAKHPTLYSIQTFKF